MLDIPYINYKELDEFYLPFYISPQRQIMSPQIVKIILQIRTIFNR